MKLIKQMERYAKSIKDFPYTDLEVDYTEDMGLVTVSIYWTEEGNTKSKDIAFLRWKDFTRWVNTPSCERTIRNEVHRIFSDFAGYLDDEDIAPKSFIDGEVFNVKKEHALEGVKATLVKDGKLIHILNTYAFAIEHKISLSVLADVIAGKKHSIGGYYTEKSWEAKLEKQAAKEEAKKVKTVTHHFEDLDGNIYEVSNIPDFCRDKPYSVSGLSMLVKGSVYTHKGLFLAGNAKGREATKNALQRNTEAPKPFADVAPFILLSPEGKEVLIEDLHAFSEKMGMKRPGFLLRVRDGAMASYQGWTSPETVAFDKAVEKMKAPKKKAGRKPKPKAEPKPKKVKEKPVKVSKPKMAPVTTHTPTAKLSPAKPVKPSKPLFQLCRYSDEALITVENMRTFAEENGWHYVSLSQLKTGKHAYLQSKTTGEVYHLPGNRPKTFVISHKETGQKIMFWSIKQACNEHGLSYPALSKLVSGYNKSAQGWVLE